jgi:hypothetical protein
MAIKMKQLIFLLIFISLLAACKSKPHAGRNEESYRFTLEGK